MENRKSSQKEVPEENWEIQKKFPEESSRRKLGNPEEISRIKKTVSKIFLGPAWRRASPFGLGLPARVNPFNTKEETALTQDAEPAKTASS